MDDQQGISPTLRAVSDAVLAVAAELSVDEVLQRLVDARVTWPAHASPRSARPTARAASGAS